MKSLLDKRSRLRYPLFVEVKSSKLTRREGLKLNSITGPWIGKLRQTLGLFPGSSGCRREMRDSQMETETCSCMSLLGNHRRSPAWTPKLTVHRVPSAATAMSSWSH